MCIDVLSVSTDCYSEYKPPTPDHSIERERTIGCSENLDALEAVSTGRETFQKVLHECGVLALTQAVEHESVPHLHRTEFQVRKVRVNRVLLLLSRSS